MTPRISIIMPSYNHRRFIARSIDSVLDQRYPDLELIVVDGGSIDGTVEVLKQYGKKLQWISEKDAGQADAINKGLRMATGGIVAYLNSDDIYAPGSLHRVAEHFSSHPETHWLTGKCRIIDEQDQEIRRPITAYKNCLLRRFSYSLLLVTNPISQPSTFWRREVIDEIGIFDAKEHYVMDYDYWLRIGRKYPLAVMDEYLADFRVHRASKTSSSFLTSFRRELEVAKKYAPSRVLLALHWMSYLGIAAAYLVLNSLARIRRPR